MPLSWIVPLESFSPTGSTARFPVPVTTFPVTVNPASPLTRVMLVPAGNVSVDPSEPRSMIGSVVGEPKSERVRAQRGGNPERQMVPERDRWREDRLRE